MFPKGRRNSLSRNSLKHDWDLSETHLRWTHTMQCKIPQNQKTEIGPFPSVGCQSRWWRPTETNLVNGWVSSPCSRLLLCAKENKLIMSAQKTEQLKRGIKFFGRAQRRKSPRESPRGEKRFRRLISFELHGFLGMVVFA